MEKYIQKANAIVLEHATEIEVTWKLDRGMEDYSPVPVAHIKMIIIKFCPKLRQKSHYFGLWTSDVPYGKQAPQGEQEHLGKGSLSAALHFPQGPVFTFSNPRGAL